MYFLSGEDRRRLFKGIVSRGRTMTVDESLRGWNWDKPPIEPPYDTIKLGVYEVASQYCQSGRDVFVRRIDGIKGVPSKQEIGTRCMNGLNWIRSYLIKERLF